MGVIMKTKFIFLAIFLLAPWLAHGMEQMAMPGKAQPAETSQTAAPYDAIVNLGGDCQPQYQMKTNKLRPCALPFDYLITPFDSLYKILEERFEGFLKPENFMLKVNGKEKWVEDKAYGTRLIHDFPLNEKFLDEYEKVRSKYQRRIDRFLNILDKSKKVLFIRKRITREQAIKLDALISRLYPHLEYALVCLDGSEEIKTNWNLDRIRNFFLRQTTPYVWSGDNGAWAEIFAELQLESMKCDQPVQD